MSVVHETFLQGTRLLVLDWDLKGMLQCSSLTRYLSRIALLAFHLKLIIFPVKLRVDRNMISRIGKLSRASRLVGDTVLGD